MRPPVTPPTDIGPDRLAANRGADRAAFNAQPRGAFTEAPNSMRGGFLDPERLKTVGQQIRANGSSAGSKMRAAGGLAGSALAIAPMYSAITDSEESGNTMDTGQRLKALTSAGFTGLGAVAGGAVGAGLGSVAGPVGSVAGGIGGGVLGAEAFSGVAGDLREGANWVNERLGGSPDYISSVADDMRDAGYDPNPGIMQTLRGNPRMPTPAATAGATPGAGPDSAAAGAQAAATNAPFSGPGQEPRTDEDREFNRIMGIRGAPTMRQFTDEAGTRTLFNADRQSPAALAAGQQEAQSLRAGRDANERTLQAQYANDTLAAQAATRSLRAEADQQQRSERSFDSRAIDQQIANTTPGTRAREQLIGLKESSMRDFTAQQETAQRAASASAGLRSNEEIQRASNVASVASANATRQTASASASRAQANSDREFGLSTAKFSASLDEAAKSGNIAGADAMQKMFLDALPQIQGENGPAPDTASAARMMAGANLAMARRVAERRAAGDERGADSLEIQGPGALSTSDKQAIFTGSEIMKRFNERNSQIGGGADGNTSSNPLDFIIVGVDPKNEKKVKLSGGQTMDMSDVERMGLANRFGLPQFDNPRTSDYVGTRAFN